MSAPDTHEIATAVAALRRGECIGLPTETVYGLAADALNAQAVRRIFALKRRPTDHPLIVHLAGFEAMTDFVVEVPDTAKYLAEHFWPGPLTLILRRAPGVPHEVTGGQNTIALRVPAHPVAQAVLHAFGGGLAAPSANRFGHISPTRAEHVREEFGDTLPIVLNGGPCTIGIESTIIDLSGRPRILRPGSISREAIMAFIGPLDGNVSDAPRVSGSLEKHYAPRTLLRLGTRAALTEASEEALVLALDTLPANCRGSALPNDPTAYAQGLYAALRQLDALDGAIILVECPPDTPVWIAIHDRLRRAAAGSGS